MALLVILAVLKCIRHGGNARMHCRCWILAVLKYIRHRDIRHIGKERFKWS